MTLTAADVAEIMRLLEQSSFDELNLEMNGVKLNLRRTGASGHAGSTASTSSTTAASSTDATEVLSAARANAAHAMSPGEAASRTGAKAALPADPNIHDVPSPLLGTFYRAPKPGAPPFVEIGAPVEENTIVAIIEVMKLMNTVRAGVRGTVTEIIPGDGTLVEFDQPILRIRKTG